MWLRYSIGELLIASTLAAVLATLWRYVPVAGVLATVIIVPACVRTVMVLRRRADLGHLTTRGQRVSMFFASLLVIAVLATSLTALVFFALFSALLLACSDAGAIEWSGWVLIVIVAAGIVVLIFPPWFRKCWQRDIDQPGPNE